MFRSPERKVASLVLNRKGLVPPVDVLGLVSQYAEVDYDQIPGDCDAVVISISPGRRHPLVILNRDRTETRQRFTLAHELGHLLLPWHIGTHACSPQAELRLSDGLYRESEIEANQFASELLMPSWWLTELASQCTSGVDYLRAVKNLANVSWDASMVAAVPFAKPGNVFVMTIGNEVLFARKAEFTPGSLPLAGEQLNRDAFDSIAARSESFDVGGGRAIHWWDFTSCQTPAKSEISRPSAELLREILGDVFTDESERKRLLMSINGIVGAAHGGVKGRSADQILAFLRLTFADRPAIQSVKEHPLFKEFLAIKAMELSARHSTN